MKARLLILGLLVWAGTIHAQYYQYKNGSLTPDILADGGAVTIGGIGNIMAGSTQALGGQDLILTRTGPTGTITPVPNSFNRFFRLTDASNVSLNAEPVKILQVAFGYICVVGTYTNPSTTPPTQGIFVAVLTANGNVLSVRGFIPNSSTFMQCFATSATRSLQSTSRVFICGATDATTPGVVRPLVLCINIPNTGTPALVFGRVYNFTGISSNASLTPTDVVGAPYFNNLTTTREMFIVGSLRNGTTLNGFSFLVNTVTGAPRPVATSYLSMSPLEFTAVSPATGTGGGGNGYVIAATGLNSTGQSMIIIKVDSSGTVVRWGSRIDYSTNSSASSSDVIQRLNTSNLWNYYLAGTVNGGLQGAQDMAVYFVDDNGTGLAEYTYGTFADETCAEISSLAGTPANGIVVYGNGPGTTANDFSDEYYVKGYYNGVTACNFQAAVPFSNFYQVSPVSHTSSASSSFTTLPLLLVQPTISPTLTALCYQATVAGGSNARIAEEQPGEFEETALPSDATTVLQVFPTVISAASPIIQLKLAPASEQQVDIRITDMIGREVLCQKIIVSAGESVSQLQLPSGLAEGMYNLQISGEGFNETHRFIVQ